MGAVYEYLAEDHRRLEKALHRAAANPGHIESAAYLEFRGGLLRHIGMEERILLPEAQAARGGEPLPLAPKLRLDHGALAALLVLTPNHSIVGAVRRILEIHNILEEGPVGVYSLCENIPGFDCDRILLRLQNAPPVAMAPYVDSAIATESARNALRRAGHELDFVTGPT
jgi:hypothetical protein